MSSTNDTSNAGQSETPQKETSKTTSSKSRRQTKSNSGNSLVKAQSDHEVIVLSDNTRVVETDYLPNHRPIAISDLEVVGSLDAAGIRPIMANSLEFATADMLPGHRPIGVSRLHISDLHVLPGDRPIAPNDDVDPPAPVLMGYLD